jgi:hypothetical protein
MLYPNGVAVGIHHSSQAQKVVMYITITYLFRMTTMSTTGFETNAAPATSGNFKKADAFIKSKFIMQDKSKGAKKGATVLVNSGLKDIAIHLDNVTQAKLIELAKNNPNFSFKLECTVSMLTEAAEVDISNFA